MIEIKTFAKSKSQGGTSGGSSSSTTYVNTVVSEAEYASRADRAKRADNADMADYANKAGSATTSAYATKAGDIDTDNAESLLSLLGNYLRKDFVDKNEDGTEHWEKVENRTSFAELVKFLKGITASDVYSEGDVTADGDMVCRDTVKTKNLEVTGRAHFFELVIDKVKTMGGAVLITPADGFDVNIVMQAEGGFKLCWRCDDGNGKRRDNMWKVGDQALCMSFNQAKVGSDGAHDVHNKYYWALVTEVSDNDYPMEFDGAKYHYIVISATDCDGTVNPESGDSIVMLGYRGTDDADRQSAIYISAYSSLDSGLTAPLLAQYRGINDFNLASHRKSYFDAKGSRLVGDFETSSGQTMEEYVDGQVSGVKDSLDNKADKSDLEAVSSSISQTAQKISLEVSEKYASKEQLKTTGINIESGKITLTADKTVFCDGSGNEVAMFAGGKLNASLIDADAIEVKHLWAMSEDGSTKVGYIGNAENEACKVDDKTYAPLFMGGATAASSPFYVTNKGHMVTESATLGSWKLGMGTLDYDSGADEPGMALRNNFLAFRKYRTVYQVGGGYTYERDCLVWLGEWNITMGQSAPFKRNSLTIVDTTKPESGDKMNIGLRVSVEGCDESLQNSYYTSSGLYGSKLYGNFAAYFDRGMTAGLRPAIRRIEESITLDVCDHTLVCINQSEITLALPSNPQRGQYYVIIQRGVKVNIRSTKNDIWAKGKDFRGVSSWYSDTYMQESHFFFDGVEWNVAFFNPTLTQCRAF